MKYSPARYATIALVLALSLSCGAAAPAQSAEKSTWNPMTWFSNIGSGSDAQDAQKQAEQARKQAEQAKLDAEKALQRAEEAAEAAQRAADKAVRSQQASESSQPISQRPSPQQMDTKPAIEVGAPTAPTLIPPSSSGTSGNKARWNPMTWFDASTAEKPVVKEASSTQHIDPTPAPMQPEEEKAEPKNGGWNLMGFFSKGDKQPEPAKPQPDKRHENPKPIQQPSNPALALEPQLKQKAVLMETEKGNIAIELYPDEAPLTVTNFVKLVNSGFYNRYNMKFHRVIPGFVVQTGDPTGTGAGGSKDRIPLEVKNKLSHNAKGVVAMARGGDPNSASSQFYITLAPQTTLDGKYAIFGRVISGIEVVDKIEQGDMLYGVRLVDLSTITRDAPPEKKHLFSGLLPGGKSSAQ